jgi:hypothetical protein
VGLRNETECSDNGMEMNVASEPSASWSEGGSQKWTGTGQLATYVGTTQGLGGVFEIRRWIGSKGVHFDRLNARE